MDRITDISLEIESRNHGSLHGLEPAPSSHIIFSVYVNLWYNSTSSQSSLKAAQDRLPLPHSLQTPRNCGLEINHFVPHVFFPLLHGEVMILKSLVVGWGCRFIRWISILGKVGMS